MSTTPNILTWPRRIAQSRIRVHTSITGEPLSKQRPRLGSNGRTYTPRQTRDSEEWIGWQLKAATQNLIPDGDSAFGVRVIFHQSNFQRRDIDNMTKLLFDACTGIVWDDDSQVIELIAHVFRGEPDPQTEVCIYTLGINAKPTKACAACGKQFRAFPSWQNKHYCGRDCQVAATRSGLFKPCSQCGRTIYKAPHRLNAKHVFCSNECKHLHGTVALVCERCGTAFRRPRSLNRSGRKFCSAGCVADFWRNHRKQAAKGICARCGGPTSKKTYTHCRSCSIDTKRSIYH